MNRKLYEAKQDLLEAKEEYRKAYAAYKKINEAQVQDRQIDLSSVEKIINAKNTYENNKVMAKKMDAYYGSTVLNNIDEAFNDFNHRMIKTFLDGERGLIYEENDHHKLFLCPYIDFSCTDIHGSDPYALCVGVRWDKDSMSDWICVCKDIVSYGHGREFITYAPDKAYEFARKIFTTFTPDWMNVKDKDGHTLDAILHGNRADEGSSYKKMNYDDYKF